MRTLTRYVLRHRPIALVLLLVFVAAAVAAFRRLPIEAYPGRHQHPGAGHHAVARPRGRGGGAASSPSRSRTRSTGCPQRVALRSISLFGLSVVTIVFEDDADGLHASATASPRRSQAIDFPDGAAARGRPGLHAGRRDLPLSRCVGPPDMPLTRAEGAPGLGGRAPAAAGARRRRRGRLRRTDQAVPGADRPRKAARLRRLAAGRADGARARQQERRRRLRGARAADVRRARPRPADATPATSARSPWPPGTARPSGWPTSAPS